MSKHKIFKSGMICFLLVALVCFLLEFMVIWLIPCSLIQKGSEECANYLYNRQPFSRRVTADEGSTLDYYADGMLLHLIYHSNSKNPLQSLMDANYYDSKQGNPEVDYLESVMHHKEPNAGYGRYWHGSMVYLRPLLMILGGKNLYFCMLIISWIVVIGILFTLLKHEQIQTAIFLSVSFLLIRGYWMCCCLEYIPVLLLSFVMIPLYLRFWEKSIVHIVNFGIINGVLTAFFDFLTAESMTITLPLVCCYLAYSGSESKDYHESRSSQNGKKILCSLGAWILGYAGMFGIKWLLLLLGERYQFFEIVDRSKKYMSGNGLQAVAENVRIMVGIPESATELWYIVACVMWFALIFGVVLMRILGTGSVLDKIGYMILIGIPYFRFIILSEHSIHHSFFTYRAQISTVILVGYSYYAKICQYNKERKGI